jgi:hypothetical protein
LSASLGLNSSARSICASAPHHYVWTTEETIGQIHRIGPWSVNYINPADDPVKK